MIIPKSYIKKEEEDYSQVIAQQNNIQSRNFKRQNIHPSCQFLDPTKSQNLHPPFNPPFKCLYLIPFVTLTNPLISHSALMTSKTLASQLSFPLDYIQRKSKKHNKYSNTFYDSLFSVAVQLNI